MVLHLVRTLERRLRDGPQPKNAAIAAPTASGAAIACAGGATAGSASGARRLHGIGNSRPSSAPAARRSACDGRACWSGRRARSRPVAASRRRRLAALDSDGGVRVDGLAGSMTVSTSVSGPVRWNAPALAGSSVTRTCAGRAGSIACAENTRRSGRHAGIGTCSLSSPVTVAARTGHSALRTAPRRSRRPVTTTPPAPTLPPATTMAATSIAAQTACRHHSRRPGSVERARRIARSTGASALLEIQSRRRRRQSGGCAMNRGRVPRCGCAACTRNGWQR